MVFGEDVTEGIVDKGCVEFDDVFVSVEEDLHDGIGVVDVDKEGKEVWREGDVHEDVVVVE